MASRALKSVLRYVRRRTPRPAIRPIRRVTTLVSRRIGLGRLVLCASPTYIADRGAPTRPVELNRHNCLLSFNSFPDRGWRFTGEDAEEVITATGNFRTNSVEALRMAALCGHGVALLPAVIIADDLRAGNLIQLLLEFRTNEVIIQAVYPPSRHLSAKARTFIDFLASRLREDPDWVSHPLAAARITGRTKSKTLRLVGAMDATGRARTE
jgi:DNA-binding transcriptional LysR family regulator